ncbi:MAG: hypothetical protein HZB85_03970 [Deltaproteobacteria bacterium]|nr:hypothetical protein [Deltaproteobacteria bacterium]
MAANQLRKPEVKTGLLRRIFMLARGSGLTAAEREDLISTFVERISESKSSLRPSDFGLKGNRELAEFFVKTFEEMEIAPRTLRAFLAGKRIKGYQSRFSGALFHMYVKNFQPLWEDFRKVALGQVKELNELGANPRKNLHLVNARDERVKGLKFETLEKAEKIYIIKKDGTRVEFIDGAMVSSSGKGDSAYWSFLMELEVKTSSAAKEFREQIGSAQLRFIHDEVECIEMLVDGIKDPVKVSPKNIVFSPRSINRNAVSLLSESKWAKLEKIERIGLLEAAKEGKKEKIYEASNFRVQSTSKGMGESFIRVDLAVNSEEIWKIIRAVMSE